VGLTTPHSKKLIVTKVEQRKSWMDLTMMERVGDRQKKMEGYRSTGQSPQRAVVPVEEEEDHTQLETHTHTPLYE
jgi:secreted trypsin-like serine protease